VKQESAKKGPIDPVAPEILFIPNFQILGRQGPGTDVDDRTPFHWALENFAGQFENRGQPHLGGDPVELFVAEDLGEPGPDVGAPRHKVRDCALFVAASPPLPHSSLTKRAETVMYLSVCLMNSAMPK
jgi:hypothetical protein